MTESDNSTPFSAADYDSQMQCAMPYYSSFHEEAIHLIKAVRLKPKNWLDTGCGTGAFVEKALHAFPDTCFVLADPSKEMLSVAKKRLSTHRDMVEFLEPTSTQDLTKFTKTEKFDVVTAILSHHYMTCAERVQATKVCFDALAQNGVYVTFEVVMPLTSNGIIIGKENWRNFELAKGRDAQDVDEHINRFNVNYFPIKVEDHLSLLRRIGFSTVELLWYSYLQAGFYCIK